jgi:hypothetical protein
MGSLPGFVLLLSAGATAWPRRWLCRIVVLAVVGTMLWGTVRIVTGDPYFAREDWRGATAAVDAGHSDGDAVLLQDYETLIGVSSYWAGGWPHTVLGEAADDDMLEDVVSGHERIWLVLRSPHESNHRLCKSDPFDAFADSSPIIRDWLMSYRERVALDLRLPGLSVVRIDLPE